MNQFFKEFHYWEDYINGMYRIEKNKNESELINLSILMLTDLKLFEKTCSDVLINWTISSRVNLTNKQCNRKAWLGHACCNYKFNVPEILTRTAWGALNNIQQIEANNVAQKFINTFELNYEKQDKELFN